MVCVGDKKSRRKKNARPRSEEERTNSEDWWHPTHASQHPPHASPASSPHIPTVAPHPRDLTECCLCQERSVTQVSSIGVRGRTQLSPLENGVQTFQLKVALGPHGKCSQSCGMVGARDPDTVHRTPVSPGGKMDK